MNKMRKFWQNIWASVLGFFAYLLVPTDQKVEVIYMVLVYWAACFGFYVWGNIQEHKTNGNGK